MVCEDCGDIGNNLYKKGRKQGALEELDLIKLRIDELWRNEALDFKTASKIKLIIYNRKKELEKHE